MLPKLSAKIMPEDGPRNDVEVCETTIFVVGRVSLTRVWGGVAFV